MSRYFIRIASALATAVLISCGGGGGGSSGTPGTSVASGGNDSPASNTYPSVRPSVGDYAVYSNVHTDLPPYPSVQRTAITRYVFGVNADGSTDIAEFESSGGNAMTMYSSAGETIGFQAIGVSACLYPAPYRQQPPPNAAVGDTYTGAYTRPKCSSDNTATGTVNGRIVGIEQVTLPLGTFNTIKYEQTQTYKTDTNSNYVSTGAYWTDLDTGLVVKSERTTSYAGTPPVPYLVEQRQLEAYVFRGVSRAAALVERFSGSWTSSLTNGSYLRCDRFVVSTAGKLTATCRTRLADGSFPSYPSGFQLAGMVNASGQATMSSFDGTKISGTFTSSVSASGTWVSSSASGSWSADRSLYGP